MPKTPEPKRLLVRMSRELRVCPLDHGGEHNSATVYGHYASRRNCIRLKASNVWVFDPAWEEN